MGTLPTALSARELRHLQWLLGCLLSCISALTFLFLEVEAWGVLALVLGVSVIMAVRPAWPGRIPAWLRKVFLALVLGVFAWDLASVSGWLPAVTRLALLLMAYRGIGYRGRREDLQGVLLGLFLIVVAGVMTVSIAFVFVLVLFALCSLCLLYVSALADSLAGGPEQGDVPGWVASARLRRLLRRLGQVLSPVSVAVSLGLFVLLVSVSGFLFVLIPRFQMENSFFLDRLMTRKARSGFTDVVRYGQQTDLSRDESVVLNIDVPETTKLGQTPYLRMVVLDEYVPKEGFRMSAAFRQEAYGRERNSTFVKGELRMTAENEEHWIFYLEPGVSRHLPIGGPFAGLKFRDLQAYRHAQRACLLMLKEEPMTMIAYRVSMPRDSVELKDRDFGRQAEARNGELYRLSLGLPEDEASLASLRKSVVQLKSGYTGEPEPAEFAEAATRWLWERHGYALASTVPPGGEEVLVRWLRSNQPGHCELFAGSLVLLCRAAGIPARMVIGFHGGQWNGFSKNFSIRNSDAHAWCEVWDQRRGWVRQDPTPGAGARAETQVASVRESLLDESWSARFNSYRVFWYRRVVNFDQQSQDAMLSAAREVLLETKKNLVARLEQVVAKVKTWISGLGVLRSLLASIGFVMVQMLLLLLLWWLLRRWRRNRLGGSAGMPAVRREASRWLAQCEELDVGRGHPLRDRLERVRYGRKEDWGDVVGLFSEARREIRGRRKDAKAKG